MEYVETKSAWLSKVNWAQTIGALAAMATFFGYVVPPDLVAGTVTFIVALQSIITIILKTYFTSTVQSQSLPTKINSPAWIVGLAVVLALGLAGCNSAGQIKIDPAVTVRVEKGIATASDKAQVALKTICENYQAVDALFDIAAAWVNIPAKYRMTEDQAVALIGRVCAAPPNDPITAYNTIKDAWATLVAVKAQFK